MDERDTGRIEGMLNESASVVRTAVKGRVEAGRDMTDEVVMREAQRMEGMSG